MHRSISLSNLKTIYDDRYITFLGIFLKQISKIINIFWDFGVKVYYYCDEMELLTVP